MMSMLRSVVRMLLPFGLMDLRRKQIHFKRLGMEVKWSDSWRHDENLRASRYELWPSELKRAAKRWTLIDVGANVGDFAWSCHELARPDRIVSIEPQTECHEILRKRLATVPGWKLADCAVGSAPGAVTLHKTKSSSFASTLMPLQSLDKEYGDSAVIVKSETVACRTLDAICSDEAIEEVGLLKIDVQGAELDALRGAPKIP